MYGGYLFDHLMLLYVRAGGSLLPAVPGARSPGTRTREYETERERWRVSFTANGAASLMHSTWPFVGHDPLPPPRLAAARCGLFCAHPCDMHGMPAMAEKGQRTRSRRAHVCNQRDTQNSTRDYKTCSNENELN